MDPFDRHKFESLLGTESLGRNVVYRPTLESTQDLARAEAEGGSPEGTIVIADEQTAGRGRQGRRWLSPPGANLYFTIVLRPSPQQIRALSMVVPLAVAEGVEDATALTCGIKWPNDVMVGERKLAGILLDSQSSGEAVSFCLVGIGINVNFDPRPVPEIADIATSVMVELGRETAREAVLASVLNKLEERNSQAVADGAGLFDSWHSRLVNLGRNVVIHDTDGAEVVGFAESVTEDGELVLRLENGALRTFATGQLTLA